MGRGQMSMTITARARREPTEDRNTMTTHPELFENPNITPHPSRAKTGKHTPSFSPKLSPPKRPSKAGFTYPTFTSPGVELRPNTSLGFGTYGFANAPKAAHSGFNITPPKPFERESVYWRKMHDDPEMQMEDGALPEVSSLPLSPSSYGASVCTETHNPNPNPNPNPFFLPKPDPKPQPHPSRLPNPLPIRSI